MRILFFAFTLLFVGFPQGCSSTDRSKSRSGMSAADGIAKICAQYEEMLSGALFIHSAAGEIKCEFGTADLQTGAKNSVDSIYLIASTSKNFTAAGILQLAELRSDFSIENEISKFFPEYPAEDLKMNGKHIQVSHLLNHTSGIPNAYENKELLKNAFQKEVLFPDILKATIEQGKELKATTGHSLVSEPGSTYAYSNTGYLLLGEIIRRVTQRSYEEYAKLNLFGPARMPKTSIGPPKNEFFVKSYDKIDGKILDYDVANNILVRHDGEIFTDGNVYTSLRQLDQWVRALTAGEILAKASLDAMLTPGLGDYGYGWFIKHDEQNNRFIEHGGYWIGYSTAFRYYPSLSLSIGFYSNHPLDDELEKEFLGKIRKVLLTGNCEGAVQ